MDWSHMHQSSLLKRLTTNSSQLPRSPMLALNRQTKWSNVILVMESTCHAVCCIEEMLCQKMSMLPLPLSRPRDPSNLLIGAQPDSRSESTTNHQPFPGGDLAKVQRAVCMLS